MFNGQVFILHPFGSLLRLQQGLFHIVRDIDLARLPAGAGNTRDPVQVFLQAGDEARDGQAAFCQQLGDQLAFILGQGEHQVFLLNIHMLIFNGERLRPFQGGYGLLRKLVHIHRSFLL